MTDEEAKALISAIAGGIDTAYGAHECPAGGGCGFCALKEETDRLFRKFQAQRQPGAAEAPAVAGERQGVLFCEPRS